MARKKGKKPTVTPEAIPPPDPDVTGTGEVVVDGEAFEFTVTPQPGHDPPTPPSKPAVIEAATPAASEGEEGILGYSDSDDGVKEHAQPPLPPPPRVAGLEAAVSCVFLKHSSAGRLTLGPGGVSLEDFCSALRAEMGG